MKLRKAPRCTSNEGHVEMVRGRVTGEGVKRAQRPHSSAVWMLFVPHSSDVRDSVPRVEMVERGTLRCMIYEGATDMGSFQRA